MDELINQVASKAGISTDQAKAAVTTVLDFVKTKLPAPVASQLDALLQGNPPGNVDDVAKSIGGLFGR